MHGKVLLWSGLGALAACATGGSELSRSLGSLELRDRCLESLAVESGVDEIDEDTSCRLAEWALSVLVAHKDVFEPEDSIPESITTAYVGYMTFQNVDDGSTERWWLVTYPLPGPRYDAEVRVRWGDGDIQVNRTHKTYLN